jgi:hypothetical protein
MSITTSRAQRRQLARDNAKLPAALQEVPRYQWPNPDAPQLRVLRSRDFLVQEFGAPEPAIVRLSVNRTALSGDRWTDGISWEELQRLKAECGYASRDAVEVFPAERDVVNVANMRHLWVLRQPLEFAWRSSGGGT